MLARQRQTLILEELRRAGAVRVSELTELLDVSDMTIRRDLEGLADFGVVAAVDVVITDDAMPADARATVTNAVDELILVAPDAYGGT